nr:NepR family anti-sigma factor [Pseudochrobactrum asaccharolyticum]
MGANSEIGTKLRALYSSIQDETIPERFLDLLEKLDQAERKSASHSRN